MRKRPNETQLQYMLRDEIGAEDLAARLDAINARFTQYLLLDAERNADGDKDAAEWVDMLRRLRYALLDMVPPEDE